LTALIQPAAPLTDKGFIAGCADGLTLLQQITHASHALPMIMPGTGTLALEAAVISLVEPGQRILVPSMGMWGDRWRDICVAHGYQVTYDAVTTGESIDPRRLQDLLSRDRFAAVLVTHVESSTGSRADLPSLARVIRQHGALSIVDGVAALGAEAVDVQGWGLDVYLASPQKALAAPAGLALAVLGPQALAVLESRRWSPKGFGLDLARWVPVMRAIQNGEFGYFQTPPGNLLAGMRVALAEVVAEGVSERIERHRALASRLHSGLGELGIETVVRAPEHRSHGVTVCWTPPGWTSADLVDALAIEGVLVQVGTHRGAGDNTFRIGHVGNVRSAHIEMTLQALKAVTTRLSRPHVPTASSVT
jgi:alanine-glyoxylate transaminase/serine-glyoxylate transaminase/serine-pyruvate transaminase